MCELVQKPLLQLGMTEYTYWKAVMKGDWLPLDTLAKAPEVAKGACCYTCGWMVRAVQTFLARGGLVRNNKIAWGIDFIYQTNVSDYPHGPPGTSRET